MNRVQNSTLCSKTSIFDVGKRTAKLKWDWTVPVCRMHPQRWAYTGTWWMLENGQRRRDRSRKKFGITWTHMQKTCPNIASNRELWKSRGPLLHGGFRVTVGLCRAKNIYTEIYLIYRHFIKGTLFIRSLTY